MECIICNGKKFKIISPKVRDANEHKIAQCQKCQLLQLFPMPTRPEEDKEFYDENRQSKNIGGPLDLKIIRENSLADTKRRTGLILKEASKGKKVLDIGSGYGFFLKEMENLGYDAAGIEVSKEKRRISRRVTEAKVSDINLYHSEAGLSKFDCITLFHVLEHLHDPVLFLKIIKRHLNKNGKLIIEVPNADDLLLTASKNYRDFYWQRAHLFYFSAMTLKKVVQGAGFSIIEISYVHRYGIDNFMNWFLLGKPQIARPAFQTNGPYKWLEDYYKGYLCRAGKADTLTLIAKPR
ncbi:MAG: class I SAM-dependent methyltransferase [Candidatus Wildermuthbacteria bacterium]|nr:class I SAM-dependent methyltransferase [Candidatus Wildermuthbacteria bacterium]